MAHLASIARVLVGELVFNPNPNPIANLNFSLNPNANSNPKSIIFCEGANTNYIRRRSEGANHRH